MNLIQEKIKKVFETNTTPGLSVYIFYKDKEEYENYGMQNIEKGIKLTNESIWSTRSISKNISATTVAWLVDNGKTCFNTKISNVMNSIEFSNKYVTKQATVKNAFSHTTGLPTEAGTLASAYNYDREFIYKTLKYYPLSGFNKFFHYSNLGFTLGFDAARQQSGYLSISQPILEFTHKIGMKDVTIDEDIPPNKLVVPYLKEDNNFIPQVIRTNTPFEPAEDVFCSIKDLATFVKFHINKGEGIINENVLNQIYQPIVKSDNIANGIEYGMGTSINHFGDSTVYGHSGVYGQGYIHQMLYDINNRIGVVVLTNALSPVAIPLAYYIYLTLLGDNELAEKIYNEYYAIIASLIDSLNNCPNDNALYNTSNLCKLEGLYFNQSDGYVRILVNDNDYYIKVGNTQWSKITVAPTKIHFILHGTSFTPTMIINPIHHCGIIGLQLRFDCNNIVYIKVK